VVAIALSDRTPHSERSFAALLALLQATSSSTLAATKGVPSKPSLQQVRDRAVVCVV
jgi:hypothetical protein